MASASHISAAKTMLVLPKKQRAVLVDKLPDAANVAAGALVFGQFLGDAPFSRLLAVGGIVIWFTFMGLALAFSAEEP